MLDKLHARFNVGSIMIQFNVNEFCICHVDSSTHANSFEIASTSWFNSIRKSDERKSDVMSVK